MKSQGIPLDNDRTLDNNVNTAPTESEASANATEQMTIEEPTDYATSETPSLTESKQQLWERKLLDTSLRNSLVNMRMGKRVLPLVSFGINKLEDYMQEGKNFRVAAFPEEKKPEPEEGRIFDSSLYPALQPTVEQGLLGTKIYSFLTETELKKSLKEMYRSARVALEENGANNLFLVLGVLEWYETDKCDTPRYAPILLLPIEIVKGRGESGFVIRARDEEIVLNITLVEYMKQRQELDLTSLKELPKDEWGVDVKKIFADIRSLIRGKKGWKVQEESLLGIFSFNKFVMWNDIHNNAEKMKENAVVRSLLSGRLEVEHTESALDMREIDRTERPDRYLLPTEYDSSQLEAIIESGNGKTFVLHGPPGTGKSQTITNMIANALYQGKRVLFVAEKMAALSVVQSRLEKIGLTPFCLELHSNKVTKQHFLKQMEMALEVVHTAASPDFESTSKELFAKRKELINYVDALHTPSPNGVSLFDCITHYLAIQEDELQADAQRMTAFSKEEFLEVEERLKHLDTVFQITGHPSESPLKALNILSNSDADERLFAAHSKRCLEAIDTYLSLSAPYEEAFGKPLPHDTDGARLLATLCDIMLQTPYVTAELVTLMPDSAAVQEVERLVALGKEGAEAKQEILKQYKEKVLTLSADALETEWHEIECKWFLPKLFAKSSFLKRHRLYKPDFGEADVAPLIEKLSQVQKAESAIAEKRDRLSSLFGPLMASSPCRWEEMGQALACAHRFHDYARLEATTIGCPIEDCLATLSATIGSDWKAFLQSHRTLLETLQQALQQHSSAMDQLLSVARFEVDKEDYMPQIQTIVSHIVATPTAFKDWSLWCDERHQLEALDLDLLVDVLLSEPLSGARLANAFGKAYYHALATSIIADNPRLRRFNGILFEETIDKYRALSAHLRDISKQVLYRQLANKVPAQSALAADSSEIGILKRNIKNGGRGMSIRKIIDQIPTLLPKLCPCMLMSPISVAQYIDLSNDKFDLVIFDEASQMPTSEAVGAISRGRSLVVVGDPKQMPPTNFFNSNQVDEEEAAIDDMQSILDDCIALSIPSKHLTCHYRSQHESLISFSNSQYYDGQLLTFPSIDDQQSKVSLRHIEGVYDKGKSRSNRSEAEAIVAEVLRRLSDASLSRRSIGIVSFSQVQQNLIDDLLTEALAKQPALEALAYDSAEPIFVKNLENVQGDERDVILFSIGYGPDAEGNVSMNFGPLNNEGGERRLNVAVSRARYEMVIFSSLRAEQIDLKRAKSAGVEGLKRFLEFAEKGRIPSPAATRQTTSDDNAIIHEVSQALTARGYQVSNNVGSSSFKVDIAIQHPDHPEEYILGLLCDGHRYYATNTVRDREIVQPNVLQALKWNVMHIWSLDWLHKRDTVLERIISKVEEARRQPPSEAPLPFHTPKPEAMAPAKPEPAAASPMQPYTYAPLTPLDSAATIDLAEQSLPTIEQQVRTIIATEQPITADLLAKRVAKLWGIARSHRLQALIDKALAAVAPHQEPNGKEGVTYWLNADNAKEYTTFRSDSDRDIDEVPLVEIGNAMRFVIDLNIAMDKEELKRRAAQQLGYARKGTTIDKYTDIALSQLLQQGYVTLSDCKVCKV